MEKSSRSMLINVSPPGSSSEEDKERLKKQLEQIERVRIQRRKAAQARNAVKKEKDNMREEVLQFLENNYADRNTFGPDSDLFSKFLYVVNVEDNFDCLLFSQVCIVLLQFFNESGRDAVRVFGGEDYSSKRDSVNYLVKTLAYTCIRVIHHVGVEGTRGSITFDRNRLKVDCITTLKVFCGSDTPLLRVLKLLIDLKLPWSCMIVEYISQNKGFSLLREFILTRKDDSEKWIYSKNELWHFLSVVLCHNGQKPCICSDIDLRYSFSSQILTIPDVWNVFPSLKKVIARQGMIAFLSSFLPKDISDKFLAYVRLLGNIFKTDASFPPGSRSDVPIILEAVSTFWMKAHPSTENSMIAEDDMTGDDKVKEVALDWKVDQQSCYFIETHCFLTMIHQLFIEISNAKGPYDMEVVAVDEVCGFLYPAFPILPDKIKHGLAYASGLIPVLWDFIKRRHENERLSSLSDGTHGWLLPLAVFCPLYNLMLKRHDNKEFYEQEKPLSLNDIRSLIILLKQALWQLLWENHTLSANSVRSIPVGLSKTELSVEAIQQHVIKVVSELLSQLQDWNNREEFTPPSDFYADGVNQDFISQAVIENTRANEILKKTPFLIPFTNRVKILKFHRDATRQIHESQAAGQKTLKIRRHKFIKDGYPQMRELSIDDLQGNIRVTFVNKFGTEEHGQDDGGLFKDFMDNITRALFGVKIGLFKETKDHLLYPNPGSGDIHTNHLTLFYFLGTLLAKAMFDEIPVDLPFASFFLRKFKDQYVDLQDLPSLDPELYRHLISLKHYEGDISELEQNFVIYNEYGKKKEEKEVELLPEGNKLCVDNKNFLAYIRLVANYRLNSQMHHQCFLFMAGFQRLIPKDWTDMFNERELQLLISGSRDNFNVDDLQLHTKYVGYNSEHCVIKMFWEVLRARGFSMENKKKLLKFVTSCRRGPTLGFRDLKPQFTIQRDYLAEDDLERLPRASTCLNSLYLPPYKSKDQLESKLLYAINADAGFEFS